MNATLLFVNYILILKQIIYLFIYLYAINLMKYWTRQTDVKSKILIKEIFVVKNVLIDMILISNLTSRNRPFVHFKVHNFQCLLT